MENKNQEQLQKLAKIFNTDNVITADQIKSVLTGIVAILGTYKTGTEKLNSDTKNSVLRMVDQIQKEHADVLSEIRENSKTLSSKFEKLTKELKDSVISRETIEQMSREISTAIINEKCQTEHNQIVSEVLSQIKLPENKVLTMSGGDIANALETLTGEERLKATAIAGLEEMIDQRIAQTAPTVYGGRGGIQKDTIGGGVTRIKVAGAGITMTSTYGDRGMGVVTLTVSGGGGGSGDVVGPGSATDNAIARFDSTTGKLIQNSVVTIADTTGNMAGVGTINTLVLPTSNFVGLTDAQTLSNKILDEAKIINGGFIKDGNGNELLIFTTTASAVNELTFNNAATGNNPRFQATGGDSNIGIDLLAKGTGSVNIRGNATLAGEIRIYEDTGSGTNYSAFRGSARTTDVTYLMPTADPTSGQALTSGAPSGGVAQLSWTTISGMSIGGTVTSGTTGSVLFIGSSAALTQDNANFFWDDTNNYLGLGTNTPGRTLHIKGDVTGGVLTVERTNTSTNAVLGTSVILGTSTGDMTDGFGAAFQFAIKDNAGVENIVSAIRTYRAGADNSGTMDFVTYTSGVSGIVGTVTTGGDWSFTPKVRTTGSPNAFKITGAAHTTLTASTEASDVVFNFARTVQFATGAKTRQTAFQILAPTYSAVAATTITDSATVYIDNPPQAGTNVTLTRRYSLWAAAGVIRADDNFHAGVGSNTAPSFSFVGDTNTGFYRVAASRIGVAINGSGKMDMSSTYIGSFTTGGFQIRHSQGNSATVPVYAFFTSTTSGMNMSAANTLNLITNSLTAIEIDSAQKVSIGGQAPVSTLDVRGSFSAAYVAKTANYTATVSDHTIECTANTFQVTLPTAVGIAGRIYVIANSGAGTITIGTTSSQTFVNVAATPTTLTLATVGSYRVQSNGANWLVI